MITSSPVNTGRTSLARRGWLRHGNRPGDYAKLPRCGARTRAGGCCRQPAMRHGRCRMHGGLSTGPRTAEGLARSRRARWKHGFCSTEIRTLRRNAAQTCRNLAFLVRLARELERRPASSLGMGFIERNCPAAGRSSSDSTASSLGMGLIERIEPPAGRSSGESSPPRPWPGPARGSG